MDYTKRKEFINKFKPLGLKIVENSNYSNLDIFSDNTLLIEFKTLFNDVLMFSNQKYEKVKFIEELKAINSPFYTERLKELKENTNFNTFKDLMFIDFNKSDSVFYNNDIIRNNNILNIVKTILKGL